MIKLERKLVRETETVINDKPLIVTLSPDNHLELKLKGDKKPLTKISFDDLYDKLVGSPVEVITPEIKQSAGPLKIRNVDKTKNNDDDVPKISLYEFRSKYLVSGDIPLNIKVKLESITVGLIKEKSTK